MSAVPAEPKATAPSLRRQRAWFVLLLLLASFVHGLAVLATVNDNPLRSDSGEYLSYAFNLDRYGVYSMDPTWQRAPEASPPTPDAYRPPGYPLFLRALGDPEPTEDWLRRVMLAQAGLGVAAVALLFFLARRFLSFRGALAAGALAALSPHLAVLSTVILSESLFCFGLLASLLATVRAAESGSKGDCVLAGALWGATSLVRSTAEFFPPLLLAAVWLAPGLRRFRMQATLGFAVFLLTLSPWIVRKLSDDVVKPPSSLLVKALAHGSYPGFMYQDRPESFGFPYRFDPHADAIARDLPSTLRHILGRFREEPARYLRWYLFGKPGYFLAWGHVQGWDILINPVFRSPFYEGGPLQGLRLGAMLLHWPLMVLGLCGAVLAWSRRWWPGRQLRGLVAARMASALFVYGLAFHLIVAPFPRYGLPFRALIYALALLAVSVAWRWLRGQRAAQCD